MDNRHAIVQGVRKYILLYGKKLFFFARQRLIIVFILCVHFVYAVLTRLQTLLVGNADFCNQVRKSDLEMYVAAFITSNEIKIEY